MFLQCLKQFTLIGFTRYFKVEGTVVTHLPLDSAILPKRLRMVPNAFLRLFPSDPEEEAHGHPLIPEKFLLFAKVHLTVWWSLWLSYFLKGVPCLYSPNLITTISRYRYKAVPLELRGDQQSLEPFSANDGYYRYVSSLSQFEITSIQIKPHSFVAAKGCPCMNTTPTCQSWIGSK